MVLARMLPPIHLRALAYKENKMAVTVLDVYKKSDGSTPIAFGAWIETLPVDRQTAFVVANQKQQAIEANLNSSGHLLSNSGLTKEWASADAYHAVNTPDSHDPDWMAFWDEYITVNDVTFTQVVTGE